MTDIGRDPSISIRKEQGEDVSGIRNLPLETFETPLEAEIVDGIRNSRTEYLSLVAVADNQLVGHELFSPVMLEGTGIVGMGLGPRQLQKATGGMESDPSSSSVGSGY